ncbi:MAG: mechanosensitive ion channel domain-containing protein [Planctomycetota bacterium]
MLIDYLASLIPVAIAIAVAAHTALYWALARSIGSREHHPSRRLLDRTRWPALIAAVVAGIVIGVTTLTTRGLAPEWLVSIWPRTVTLSAAATVTWLVVAFIGGADDIILARYKMDTKDNLKARRMHTQVRVLSRILQGLTIVVGVSIALTAFESVEKIGASLLASAGIAGIVVGFAARPVLENVLAGLQIALTQPIRLDDAVVIKGEWGWVEEITTTYVVIKIWDERRLIVPFKTIIEQPFQNWTRTSSHIMGSVTLHVDYRCPIEPVRAELDRILESHPLWDRRAKVLQVIEATQKTIQLRALMTAEDSPKAWDLRCAVREQLIAFLQREHPDCLPRERVALEERSAGSPDPGPISST